MKVAIIGSGISGLSAAWALKDRAEVTLFEARERIGGHSCTMDIDYDGTPISVDVGFIVYNAINYPNLIALFEHLGPPIRKASLRGSGTFSNLPFINSGVPYCGLTILPAKSWKLERFTMQRLATGSTGTALHRAFGRTTSCLWARRSGQPLKPR